MAPTLAIASCATLLATVPRAPPASDARSDGTAQAHSSTSAARIPCTMTMATHAAIHPPPRRITALIPASHMPPARAPDCPPDDTMLCAETHLTMPSDQHPAAAARSALRTKPPPRARPNPPFSRARDVPVHTFPDLGSHTRPHALPIWTPRRHAHATPPRAGSTPAKPHQALRHGPTLHHKQPNIRNTTTTQKHHDTQHNTPNSPSTPSHRRHQ